MLLTHTNMSPLEGPRIRNLSALSLQSLMRFFFFSRAIKNLDLNSTKM